MDDENGFPVTLFPELPPPAGPRWEVTLTLRHEPGGEPVVPCASGVPGVMAAYSVEMAQAIVVVGGPEDEAEAEAAARLLCSGMAWVAGAGAEVRPVTAGELVAGG